MGLIGNGLYVDIIEIDILDFHMKLQTRIHYLMEPFTTIHL